MKKSGYAENIRNFKAQFSFQNIHVACADALKKRGIPKKVVICGMGGSGLSAKILSLLSKDLGIPVPIESHKNYGIPWNTEKNTLFIFSSFSGNTEETISGFMEALKKKRIIAVVTTGGQLKKLAEKHKIPHALFPKDLLTPREAVGYNYLSVLSLLRICFPKITVTPFSSNSFPTSLEKHGKALAGKMKKKITLLYAEERFSGVLDAWKINLNETAKQLAFANYIPEMNHNEIAAVQNAKNTIAVFFEDMRANPPMKKRMRISEKMFLSENIPTIRVSFSGKNLEERVWRSIALSHWVSFFIAQQNHTDPAKTERIEQFKKTMRA